jgi:hypothetical protein
VQAQVALAQGDPELALERLERMTGEYPAHHITASPFCARVTERFLRAEALEAAGRTTEALGWYENLAQRSPFELLLLHPAADRSVHIRWERHITHP